MKYEWTYIKAYKKFPLKKSIKKLKAWNEKSHSNAMGISYLNYNTGEVKQALRFIADLVKEIEKIKEEDMTHAQKHFISEFVSILAQ